MDVTPQLVAPPTLVNKPNKDTVALVRAVNQGQFLAHTATWDAEFNRMFTSTPDWSP